MNVFYEALRTESLPVFCINVSGSERGSRRWGVMLQRWKAVVESALREHRIRLPPLTRWEATTPADLPDKPTAPTDLPDTLDPPAPSRFAHYLSPGQRSCAWSHRRLWEEIAKLPTPSAPRCALILEDDVVFRKGWLDELIHAPEDAEMLLLNASEEVMPAGAWVRARDQCMAAAYMLTSAAAVELLRLSGEVVHASDWTTQLLQRRGRSWTLFPWLAIQDGADSFLQPGGTPDADLAKVKRLLGRYVGEDAFRELYMWEEEEGPQIEGEKSTKM